MKNNNKGYVLTEVLIVTVVVLVAFLAIYVNYYPMLGEYERRIVYTNLEPKYSLFHMKEIYLNPSNKKSQVIVNAFRNDDNLKYLDLLTTEGNTTVCNSLYVNDVSYCNSLVTKLGINRLIVSEYNVDSLKSVNIEEKLDKYIDYLPSYKYVNDNRMFRLIGDTVDGYATSKLDLLAINSLVFEYIGESPLDHTYNFLPNETRTLSFKMTGTRPLVYYKLYEVNNDDFEIKCVIGDLTSSIAQNETKVVSLVIKYTGSTAASNIDLTDLYTVAQSLTQNNFAVLPEYIDMTSTPNYQFVYSGGPQEITVPLNGYYYVNLYGAQGGSAIELSGDGYDTNIQGGKGAKTDGYAYFNQGDRFYLYVGGKGENVNYTNKRTITGGYNGGGGASVNRDCYQQTGSGGGATDMRYFGTTAPSSSNLDWNSTAGLNSRIMVAAGGGGVYQNNCSSSDKYQMTSPGVRLYGNKDEVNNNVNNISHLGTQTNGGYGRANYTDPYNSTTYGGTFGTGASGKNSYGGGGGGYYGGGSGDYAYGGGGSSFISGYAGVNAITSQSSSTHTNTTMHYSNKYFMNGKMTSGDNTGNGKVIIVYKGATSDLTEVNTNLNSVRYIKDCIVENANNTDKKWTEIQAIKDGVNLAKGKTPTSVNGGTLSNGSYITDGKIYPNSQASISATGEQCIKIDLGSTNKLTEVAAWHESNKYYTSTLYVSSNNSTWYPVASTSGIELSDGARSNIYQYTLTYDNQGGIGCGAKAVDRGSNWGELCTPTTDGYRFNGWFTGTNGTGTRVTSETVANSNLTVYAYLVPTNLYAVMKQQAEIGTYAKKYTGSHQDSMNASLSNKDIYYWYGSSTANGTAILDKNNVIFANHCWQMIRTTDTGGVRMIYNGEAVDGKCLNTRGTHVGYGGSRSSQSLNGTYWYGTDYTYDSSTNKFSISGTKTSTQVTTSNGSTVIPTLVGKYTCKSTSESGTCSTLYLIESYDNSYYAYSIPINSSSHYSQFGTIPFNANADSLAYVGYMYNEVYPITRSLHSYSITSSTSLVSLSSYGYYSDTISYNGGQYNLTNPQLISSLSDTSELVGKYMLRNGGNTSDTTARYIVGIRGTTLDYRELENGDLNTSMMIGPSYADNGNGTYTIQSATSLTLIEWYNSSDLSIYKGKYVCDGTSATCSNLKHIASSQNPAKSYYFYCSTEMDKYKYGEGVSYNNGTYTLTGDIETVWDIYDSTELGKIVNHKYTCSSSTSTTCTTVKYAIYLSGISIYYTELSDVSNIDAAVTKMLLANNVNTKNSVMKFGIEKWYEKYLLPYDSYIDDTIYCNDRSITTFGAFTESGAITGSSSYLKFPGSTSSYTNLSCPNTTDRFSILNSTAPLAHKVGLVSTPEMNLLYNSTLGKTGEDYWTISPHSTSGVNIIYERIVTSSGGLGGVPQTTALGARPVISLIPGIEYTSGDGSMANPYVVDTSS